MDRVVFAHKWFYDFMTHPNIRIKMGCISRDIQILGGIVGVRGTGQWNDPYGIFTFDLNIIVLFYGRKSPMDKKEKSHISIESTKFVLGGFVLLIFFSIAVFAFLGTYMSRQSEEAIDDLGNMYMTSMGERICKHFETIVNLRLKQAEAVATVVSADGDNLQEIYDELIYRTEVRDFVSLALCSESGEFETLYGEPASLIDPEPFLQSLRDGERKVAVAANESGEQLVLFGVNAKYPMSDGEESIATVMGVPAEEISEELSLEKESIEMYAHIIRTDGTFIIRDESIEYPDYFSYLRGTYSGDTDRDNVENYITDLTSAMEEDRKYVAILEFGGGRQQVITVSLSNSEWNLVIVMPYGVLNQAVESLNEERTAATLLTCGSILVFLLFLFFVYYRMSKQQIYDLNEARQAAEEATRAKSEFLSNMSHDIRTPMNAIVGMTAIATAHVDDKEQVQNCLKKIALSGKHLLGLINDVLDMSKIESGKMTLTADMVSLREVMEAIVGIVQPQVKAKHQNFEVHIDRIISEDVYCDSVRLNQVLLNLLSNSVKYTHEGGVIRLSLYQEESPKGEGYVRTHIRVKDNGIGMSPEFISKIFESYSRADNRRVHKTEGAGLGMAITKYIIDAMEGSIDVESELSKGSEFHVTIDFEKATVKEVDMILPDWKMLVVDDDETLCRTAVEALDAIGIQADWTLSGEKALKMIMEHHEKRDDYQIILLDWKLPGMDGIQLAREIRRGLGDTIPILLISAYDWSEFENEARAAGISGFIAKPLFKSTLFYGLQKYMGSEVESLIEETKATDLSGHRLLVAEDNSLNWEVLHELLTDLGLELEWAENGQICAEMFEKAEEDYYDAVLMDVRMPVMTGYEATRAIRTSTKANAQTIPIIAMTADAFAEDIQRCLDCGMNAHTAKPINVDELLLLLKRYLHIE